MELSARNQLKGEVKVEAGNVVAAITDGSLKRLGIKAGDRVTIIVKATEVMIGK
jgi:molybdopterin-binding protein